MEMWKYGDIGNKKIWKYVNVEMWKYANMEMRKYGNTEIWK